MILYLRLHLSSIVPGSASWELSHRLGGNMWGKVIHSGGDRYTGSRFAEHCDKQSVLINQANNSPRRLDRSIISMYQSCL
jgi:hypothetical protein